MTAPRARADERRAPAPAVRAALAAVDARFGEWKRALAVLVRIPSVSAEGFPKGEVRRSAEATAALLRKVALEHVEILEVPGVHPYVYADWLHAPGAPTVLVYGHHDVVPPGRPGRWTNPPFEPVERKGRLYGRGTADDKGGFLAHVAAVAAFLGSSGALPVNVKLLIEGEEETGSAHLGELLRRYRDRIDADVLVLSDTSNFGTGIPALTCELRGLVQVDVEVACLDRPVHSGDYGGAVPDAVRILCRMLDDLRGEQGEIAVPGLYRKVAKPSAALRKRLRALPFSAAAFRHDAGLLPGTRLEGERGYSVYEQLWTRPSLTVIAVEAHPVRGSANQILDSARARISMRTVPNMDSREAGDLLIRKLTTRPPAGAHVSARLVRWSPWWRTEPVGPAFDAARRALEQGYGRKAALIGAGGSIGFVQPFTEALPGVPCLLTGVEDPACVAHSEDESLHLGDWKRSMRAAVYLYDELATLGRTALCRRQR